MQKWCKIGCEHCDIDNWVCIENQDDYFASQIEVVRCHNCKKKFWLDSSFAIDYHSDGFESGEDCLENCSYWTNGLKTPIKDRDDGNNFYS
jgi:hypothetical protein